MAGVKRKASFTSEFLVRHGAAEGSSLHMTPTGFMTAEAWEMMAPHQIIKANPDWKVGAHVSSASTMQLKADAGIICVKEEGGYSHVNQGYGKFVAKKTRR